MSSRLPVAIVIAFISCTGFTFSPSVAIICREWFSIFTSIKQTVLHALIMRNLYLLPFSTINMENATFVLTPDEGFYRSKF